MSKQKGLIKLEGNIGGISFYQAGGEFLARSASGPSKQRIASDPALNSIGAVGYSELTALSDPSASFNLGAELDEEPGNDNKLSVVQCLGIEFFQVIGGNQYLLAQGNAMKVVDVE